jgi:tRNA(fMet)-specific endonuclease VapC
VGTVLPVVGELFAGAENSSTRTKNLRLLRRRLNDLIAWPFDRSAAEEYGRLWAHLRRNGRPMQQIDIQIAAVALSMGGTIVVTKDSDFAAIPGLVVEDWSQP